MAADREDLIRRAEARLELSRREIDKNCAVEVISHKQGPMYWMRSCTKTENYQWQAQGLNPVAPFPYKPYRDRKINLSALPFPHDFTEDDPPDYLDLTCGYMLVEKELWIPKSREMVTSWLTVGFITWACQFFEKTGWVGQSEKDDKAQGLIKYSNILYRNQEPWMKGKHPLASGDDVGTLHRVDWANGSWFIAVPQGERQLASHHPTGYFCDEASHQPGVERTRGIALPAVRKSIFVSTPAPGWWWNSLE